MHVRPSARDARSLFVFLLGVALLLAASTASAQTRRILLVGDSWVDQAWSAGAFDTALANQGLSQFAFHGGPTTIGGTTAAQWATQPYLDLITAELNAHPTLDIVHLSVGGNDFLGAPPGTDPVQLAQQILADVTTITNHIKSIRPDALITVQTYDYTPAGFNTEQIALAQLFVLQAEALPDVYINNSLGLLHHVFGYTGQFGPGETPKPGRHPNFEPLAGGNPAFAGDPALFADAIHPNVTGYIALAEHAIEEIYEPWLFGSRIVPGLNGPGIALLSSALAFVAIRQRRRG